MAVDADGVVDAAIERPGAPDGVGDVHRGRVTARTPAMAGVFVAIGGAEGFWPDTAGAAGRNVGDVVAVRIIRSAQGGKGPRLAAADAATEPGPPSRLRSGPGAVARLRALHPDAPVVADSHALAARTREFAPTVGPFDEMAWQACAEPTVELPGGGRLRITPTPALVAIDVDLASVAGERGGAPAVHEAANRRAIPAIARQIRVRNLSGAIVVDLAGLGVRRRAALGPVFAAALATDPCRPRFLGFSALGLAEILRPRGHPPLHEVRAGPHAAALAALRMARTGAGLRVAPAVAAAIDSDECARTAFLAETGRAVQPRVDAALPRWGWTIDE